MIIDWMFLLKAFLRLFASVVIGLIIGGERAKHGRAAGMRTHTLVALGACLTSLMSVYINEVLGTGGDIMRISAQVVSGIGFLGAGMIIIKNNDINKTIFDIEISNLNLAPLKNYFQHYCFAL